MATNTTHKAQIFALAQTLGILRPRDLVTQGVPPIYLSRLVAQGLLKRVGRGLYTLPDASVTEHHTLAEAAKRVPQAVVCLLSALCFHELTTQLPFQVWLAIENKAWRPQVTDLPLRFVRFSGQAFTTGIEVHQIEGVTVRVYTPAKTVADCFKYRHKIGLDVALEALRDGLRQRKFTVDSLWHAAQICRVANVIKPYMEAMV